MHFQKPFINQTLTNLIILWHFFVRWLKFINLIQTIFPLWLFTLKLFLKRLDPCQSLYWCNLLYFYDIWWSEIFSTWVLSEAFIDFKIQTISSTLRWRKFSFLIIVDNKYVFHSDTMMMSRLLKLTNTLVFKIFKGELQVPWSPIARKLVRRH